MPEPIVTLNEESLKTDLRELVRKTVEDTLNGLLEEVFITYLKLHKSRTEVSAVTEKLFR